MIWPDTILIQAFINTAAIKYCKAEQLHYRKKCCHFGNDMNI